MNTINYEFKTTEESGYTRKPRYNTGCGVQSDIEISVITE